MKKCRIFKNSIKKIINFKKINLVENFLKKKKDQKKYNISLNYCKKCKHVQIKEVLNPNLLFKNYLWETGISKSNISLINNFINKMEKFRLNSKSNILEIASNDGSLIGAIKKKFNSNVLGVDPAQNLKTHSKKKKN